MAMRMLSKNIISHYCNNFAITPSSLAWKVSIFPGIKLVRPVWIFKERIKTLLSGAHVLHVT